MCQGVGQIQELEFSIQLGQDHGILSVVLDKPFEVLIVQLIQGAFKHGLGLAQFIFSNGI